MGQDIFDEMSLWVPKMILPAWEPGLLFEAKDASENARNRKSLGAMG